MLADRLRSLRNRPDKSSARPQDQAPEPLGLSSDQLALLQSLRQTPAWQHYQRALDRLYEQNAKALFGPALDHNQYLYQSGAVHALEQVIGLIDNVTRIFEEYERVRTARTAGQPVATHDLTFFGSSLWDAHRKRQPYTTG